MTGECGITRPTALLTPDSLFYIFPELPSYAEMSQKKHPALFGAPAAVGWFEIWDGLKATALSVINDDVSVHKHDDLLFMQRDGDTTTSEVCRDFLSRYTRSNHAEINSL